MRIGDWVEVVLSMEQRVLLTLDFHDIQQI
jgi:hypothetical protein